LSATTGAFSSTLGVTGLITATAGVSAVGGLQVPDGAGLTSDFSGTARTLIERSSATLVIGENGGWTNATYDIASGTHALKVGGTTRLSVTSSGADITGAATATTIALGGNEAFTYDEGSFTATATGLTTAETGTVYYVRVGKQVTLHFPLITGTSNSTAFTLTGLPADLQPASLVSFCPLSLMMDNGNVQVTGTAQISNGSGTIVLYRLGAAIWTASGTKHMNTNSITYSLQ
jgi:hypothetical protein